MGLLNRMIEDDESAAEKIDRLRNRRDQLQTDLADAEEQLDELESTIAEATAAGAMEEIADGRSERTELRDEIDDLTAALEVVEAKIDELTPDLFREQLQDLGSDYEAAYDRAADALDELEDDLADALAGIIAYFNHLNSASDAASRMHEVSRKLTEAGLEGEVPVETANTDKRLLHGRPHWLRRAVERWGSSSVMENYLKEVDR